MEKVEITGALFDCYPSGDIRRFKSVYKSINVNQFNNEN